MYKASTGELAMPSEFDITSTSAGDMFLGALIPGLVLVGLYMTPFATDVLLISPGAMGAIFMVSRLWDAISDPIAGFLSDRTRNRLGRRRPWILAGTLCSLAFLAWMSLNQDLSNYGIYMRMYDVSGSSWRPEERVNTVTSGSQTYPRVAMDTQGNFIIVWEGPEGIWIKRYDASGAAAGSDEASGAAPSVGSPPSDGGASVDGPAVSSSKMTLPSVSYFFRTSLLNHWARSSKA